MKLSKTQQAIVDKMQANNLIIDVNHGLGISGKNKAVLTDKAHGSGELISMQTVQSLKDKGIIYQYGGSYSGITHHFYKLK